MNTHPGEGWPPLLHWDSVCTCTCVWREVGGRKCDGFQKGLEPSFSGNHSNRTLRTTGREEREEEEEGGKRVRQRELWGVASVSYDKRWCKSAPHGAKRWNGKFFFFFWRDDKLNSILELVKMKMKRGYKRSGLTIDQNERNWVSGWVQPTQNAWIDFRLR